MTIWGDKDICGICAGVLVMTFGIIVLTVMLLNASMAPAGEHIIFNSQWTYTKGDCENHDYIPDDYGMRSSSVTKNITLYLHNFTANVPGRGNEKIMNTSFPTQMGYKYESSPANIISIDWYLKPPIAGSLTLNGTVVFRFYMAGVGANNFADVTFSLYNYTSTWGDDLIVSGTISISPIHSGVNPYFIQATITTPYHLSPGSYLHLNLFLQGNAAVGNDWTIYWGNESYPSLLKIECENYIQIGDGWTEDYNLERKINFDPSADNKTLYIKANITDPFGSDDIKWVNATLLSPFGEIILDHVPMIRISNGSYGFWNVYSISWNYSGYATGVYTVIIDAVDNTGYYYRFPANPGDESFGGHLEKYTYHFTIGESVYVNTLVQDTKNRALSGGNLIVKTSTGMEVYNEYTNATGGLNLTLTTGTYIFQVFWEDVCVYNQSISITRNWTYDAPLYINCTVYDVVLLVVDSLNAPMEDASLYIMHPNGSMNLLAYKTNETGQYPMFQIPGGNFTVKVLWRDVIVNTTILVIDDNTTYRINCSVYQLTIHAMDSIGVSLKGAQVVITNVTSGMVFDSQITNTTGNITSQLPVGNYSIEIYWQETLVYQDDGYMLVDNSIYAVTCAVYYLNITAIDFRGEYVIGAQVVILTPQGSVLDSQVTDSEGKVYTRLPEGSLKLRIYWQDVLVNATDNLIITGNTPITATCSIYYLEITALDLHPTTPKPLSHATVIINSHGTSFVFASAECDFQGWTEIKLPIGTYDIYIIWRDVVVYSVEGYALNITTQTATFYCNVYYVNITAVDSMAVPLDGAKISFYVSSTGRLMYTDTLIAGSGVIARLPSTMYDIYVTWFGVGVGEIIGYDLISNVDIAITCRVYYLNITAVDSHGISVDGATVEMYISGSTRPLAVGLTDEDGNLTIRLPSTLLDIYVYWFDHLVNHTNDLYIDATLANNGLLIECNIFYLTVDLYDTDGIPVENALVIIYSNKGQVLISDSSDNQGIVHGRLPQGYMQIYVFWKGVNVATVSNYYIGDVIDPVIGIECSIYSLQITAIDDHGLPLENATVRVYLHDTNTALFHGSTNDNGVAIGRLPGANYDIYLYWKDVMVYENYNYTLMDESSENLVAECRVYYLTFTLKDAHGVSVANAMLTVNLSLTNRILDQGITDADGICVIRLPGTNIDFTAVWKTVVVNETENYEIISTTTLEIACSIYYLHIKAMDSMALSPLPYASFSVYKMDGTLIATGNSNITGECTIRLPAEDYLIYVSWQNTQVLESYSYILDGDADLTLLCSVYYLTLKLVDLNNYSVPLATVWINDPRTGQILEKISTDDSGTAKFRLPVGIYEIYAMWYGHMVYTSTNYTLIGNITEEVICSIYYLHINAVDSMEIPLSEAIVSIKSRITGNTLGIAPTDNNGSVIFRLPRGEYSVIISWRGIIVYSVEDYVLNGTQANVMETCKCWVYYITTRVLDDYGIGVEESTIMVYIVPQDVLFDTYIVDTNGTTTMILPKGKYNIKVVWRNIVINTTEYVVMRAELLNITSQVHYLTLVAKDARGTAVTNAEVIITHVINGETYFTSTTDGFGKSVARLPRGTYNIIIQWMGVTVGALKSYTIDTSHELTMDCSIFYLLVVVKDKENNALSGVYVTIMNENGESRASGRTHHNGTLIFRLPHGKYTVHTRLKTTYEMTEIDMVEISSISLTSSQKIEIKFKKYPISYERTGSFMAATSSISIIVLVILVLLAISFKLKKRKGKLDNGGQEGQEGEVLEEETVDVKGDEETDVTEVLGDIEDDMVSEEIEDEDIMTDQDVIGDEDYDESESFEDIAEHEYNGDDISSKGVR